MSDEKKPDQVFVIQVQRAVGRFMDEAVDALEGEHCWVDLTTVTIAANVPRRKALMQALSDAGLQPSAEPLKLRALDVKSAEVHEPKAVQPPMQWSL